MNRLVLIGNGFDLAHGLKTSYKDFIYWYWNKRVEALVGNTTKVSEDSLCKMTIKEGAALSCWNMFASENLNFKNIRGNKTCFGYEVIKFLQKYPDAFSVDITQFFGTIMQSIETRNWVDIENEYYKLLTESALIEEDGQGKIDELNEQLEFIKDKLIDYLSEIKISDSLLKPTIRQKIYAPFKQTDISIEGQNSLKEHVEHDTIMSRLDYKHQQYGSCYSIQHAESFINKYHSEHRWLKGEHIPQDLLLPNKIMLLNFNYTHTAHLYCKTGSIFTINQIHGDVEYTDSIIFGYGDELDEDYKKISNLNDNKLLANMKSIKYLEANKYRKMLAFIESEPYQVLIMGHSCGNSDRTLLNKIFEHKNCVSIKPYYYIKGDGSDNYLELVQNIHRNFTDMNLMRDRVVNKLYCETLT